ncbi:hypothetical protein BVY04_03880 [bacterium M21]|nr:hypothetical protein BVY04_03880 [bacterium M21]
MAVSKLSMPDYKNVSPDMTQLLRELDACARHGKHLILFGEPGTGKESLTYRFYSQYKSSQEATKTPWLKFNCAGISSQSAVSLLFGHVKGAFTGAVEDHIGLFAQAKGGVLFLDEIGDLAEDVQPMLLRALEAGEAWAMGAKAPYDVRDVVVVAATERPRGSLREALLNRFTHSLDVPSLSQRLEELPDAIQFHAARVMRTKRPPVASWHETDGLGKSIESVLTKFCEAAIIQAEKFRWPGNFRTLRSAIEMSILLAGVDKGRGEFLKQCCDGFCKYSLLGNDRTRSHPPKHDTGPAVEEDSELLNHVILALPESSRSECKRVTRFLQEQGTLKFKRRSFDHCVSGEVRTVQKKLKALALGGVLVRSGNKGELYHLSGQPVTSGTNKHFLPLPLDVDYPEDHEETLEILRKLLHESRNVFLAGNRGAGKTTCAQAVGLLLAEQRPVHYYPFGGGGLKRFLQILDQEIQERGIATQSVIKTGKKIQAHEQVISMSHAIAQLFPTHSKPILILDSVDVLESEGKGDALRAMLQFWEGITFLLVGKAPELKLLESMADNLAELELSGFGK